MDVANGPRDDEGDPMWTVGRVLKRCRMAGGVGRSEAAGRIGYSLRGLAKWEASAYGPGPSELDLFDERYQQCGVLRDVVSAVRIGFVLLPDRHWMISAPGGPIWAWLRCPDGGRASISWGPWEVAIDVPPGPSGIVITAPHSIPNPALRFVLDEPGWCHVFPGSPPTWLGAKIVDGYQLFRPGQGRSQVLSMVGALLHRQPRLAGLPDPDADLAVSPTMSAALRGRWFRRYAPLAVGMPSPPFELKRSDADMALRARRANNLSRREAVQRAMAFGDVASDWLTDYQVRALESDGQVTSVAAVSRLDRLYGLDGRLVAGPVTDWATDALQVEFPRHWIGPVWVAFEPAIGAPKPAAASLWWGMYRRRLSVVGPAVVEMRRNNADDIPLDVAARSCRIQAGIGRLPNAVDANDDWFASPLALLRLAKQTLRSLAEGLSGQRNPDG